MHELARRRRAYNASRDTFGKTAWAEGFGAPRPARGEWNENGNKERLILLLGVIVSILYLIAYIGSVLIPIFECFISFM